MANLHVIFPDQLSTEISCLQNFDKQKDHILLCELASECTYVRHHQKKLVFILAAMRHFAESLRSEKYIVHYTKLDDATNSDSFAGEIEKIQKKQKIEKIIVTHPSDYRLLKLVKEWPQKLGIELDILPDERFLCGLDEFKKWAKDKEQLRMEFFYRQMRKKYDILMNGQEPRGRKWNFDAENRKFPKEELEVPAHFKVKQSAITKEVIKLVEKYFSSHFGNILPFHLAVTRKDALKALRQFIQLRLEKFGDYQDAMIENEPYLYHSHLSFYLNIGLLSPLECVRAAERAYYKQNYPLNAVEGFIRQIIGWREYIRGVYWLKMPNYEQLNYFEAKRALPKFYWDADTKMNCLKQCVKETKKNAYAHHIQRLMVLGNFALISSIDPVYVNEWFLIVYADAYQWVELPNVSGMILYADGGYLASKPYAAGGAYIHKMSNYCQNCAYKVTVKNGKNACPFNYLYWHFLAQNRKKLADNHRIGMMYKTYDRMSEQKKLEIKQDSEKFLAEIETD